MSLKLRGMIHILVCLPTNHTSSYLIFNDFFCEDYPGRNLFIKKSCIIRQYCGYSIKGAFSLFYFFNFFIFCKFQLLIHYLILYFKLLLLIMNYNYYNLSL